MRKNFTLTALLSAFIITANAQGQEWKHDPEADLNLSPSHNLIIHPDHNSMINPKLNWNINPVKNMMINPDSAVNINPKNNPAIDPTQNQLLNPMYMPTLNPKFINWSGLYVFSKDDKLSGYITKYSQDLLIQFDKDGNWNYFFVRTCKGTYNQFNLSADWTGNYLCFDNMAGYNLFDKQGNWTGIHIK